MWELLCFFITFYPPSHRWQQKNVFPSSPIILNWATYQQYLSL
ncbi:hypothetical protein CSC14_3429 [Proteus mirabilis]|nr:hypothetical protein CSC14_3429 [Proteus mirabilis]